MYTVIVQIHANLIAGKGSDTLVRFWIDIKITSLRLERKWILKYL